MATFSRGRVRTIAVCFYRPLPKAEDYRGHHLIGVHFPEGYAVEALKARLSQEKIYVSYRGSCMRVSPHLYNTAGHLNHLVSCFEG